MLIIRTVYRRNLAAMPDFTGLAALQTQQLIVRY